MLQVEITPTGIQGFALACTGVQQQQANGEEVAVPAALKLQSQREPLLLRQTAMGSGAIWKGLKTRPWIVARAKQPLPPCHGKQMAKGGHVAVDGSRGELMVKQPSPELEQVLGADLRDAEPPE